MAHIRIDEAAARSGVPRQTLEAWAEQGLICLEERGDLPGMVGPTPGEKFVDEEELERVVESLGWLDLSLRGWKNAEDG